MNGMETLHYPDNDSGAYPVLTRKTPSTQTTRSICT